jgi:TrmH family RNA methyltransferase
VILGSGISDQIKKPSKSQIKQWGKLTQEKYRRQAGLFLAEGRKVVSELVRSGCRLSALLACEEKEGWWKALPPDIPDKVDIYRLSAREWEAVSQDTTPEGVMAVAVSPPVVDSDRLLETCGPMLLLYRVSNPNNLGALLRTADWFGFRTVVLSTDSVGATNPKAVRTSMGSLFHLTVVEDIDFEHFLPRLRGRYQVVGSGMRDGIAPHPCTGRTALLLGNESHGLPSSLLSLTDERWWIPGGDNADSLSLPQAAAIMMYECTRKIVTVR